MGRRPQAGETMLSTGGQHMRAELHAEHDGLRRAQHEEQPQRRDRLAPHAAQPKRQPEEAKRHVHPEREPPGGCKREALLFSSASHKLQCFF